MRRLALALPAAFVLCLATTGVALAACCELAYLEVQAGNGDVLRVEASELRQSLGAPGFELLYWPAANASTKAGDRPPGDLGSAYDVTYVLHDSAGRPSVKIRETVYPDAPGGPVAVVAPGQTASFTPGKAAPVPAGWRPFPEQAAQELEAIVESGKEGSGGMSSSLVWPVLVTALGVAAVTWFTTRPSSRNALRIP